GTGSSDPIALSPMVDITNGFIYVFSGTNVANNASVVSQMNADLTSQVQASIGRAFTGQFIFDGDFDNNYFANGPKSPAPRSTPAVHSRIMPTSPACMRFHFPRLQESSTRLLLFQIIETLIPHRPRTAPARLW